MTTQQQLLAVAFVVIGAYVIWGQQMSGQHWSI